MNWVKKPTPVEGKPQDISSLSNTSVNGEKGILFSFYVQFAWSVIQWMSFILLLSFWECTHFLLSVESFMLMFRFQLTLSLANIVYSA